MMLHRPIGIIDASSGGGDAFAFAVAGYVVPPAPHSDLLCVYREGVRIHPETREPLDVTPLPPVLAFRYVDAFTGRFKGQTTASDIIDKVAHVFRQFGIDTVVGDQREAFFVASEFSRHSMRFVEIAWTNANKVDAVRHIREHLARRSIVFPPERDTLKRELLGYSERITASGAITYSARGTGHDDEASLVMTAAMAELERLIPGSPYFTRAGRHEVAGR